MSLRQYKLALREMGLQENPFRPTPPDEFDRIAKIFYGRKQELDHALPSLYEGRNVLIRGAWGIGKTALIKTMLAQLQQEVAELGEEMLILYIDGIPKPTVIDFYRSVLLALTTKLSNQSEEAKRVADNLMGMAVQSSSNKLEAGVNLGMFSLKATTDPKSNEIRENDIYQQLMYWLKEAEGIYGRVVIAVDDLDKKDTPVVQEILENSLDLFRQGSKRAFVMTGRIFTDLQDATLQALGIFSQNIKLEPMGHDDLRQITINYLNSARIAPRNDCQPFTDTALDRIIAYSQGIPRQLNLICEKILYEAAINNVTTIDNHALDTLFPAIQKQLAQNLSPQLRRLLYIIYTSGGIDEDISNQDLDRLGVLTFNQLIPALNDLQRHDLIIRGESDTGIRYLPSQLIPPPENSPDTNPPES
jgi:Cdc6-like AAA superfamily ATPase